MIMRFGEPVSPKKSYTGLILLVLVFGVPMLLGHWADVKAPRRR